MLSIIWNNIFYFPVLNLLLIFHNLLFDNLGWAIIIVAIILRLLLLPLIKNQTEMTRKMASLKPQIDALQKKYKNNPEKLSQEQIKLYRKVGYNPLGCLVTFIPQLLVLSVLMQVIRNVTNNNLDGIYPFLQSWLSDGGSLSINTKFLFWDLTRSYSDVSAEFGKFAIESLLYLFLAILVGFSQYLTSKFTQNIQGIENKEVKKGGKKKKEEDLSADEMQKQMSKSFMYVLPFTTVFIAINAPAALTLYWIVQSFMLAIQYMVLDWDKSKKGVQNLLTKNKDLKK